MNKFFGLAALLLVLQVNTILAQTDTLFYGPDSVCVYQPVHLQSKYDTAQCYYWGFCSGYLNNTPVGTNMGNNFNFHHPGNIDVVYDKVAGNYYGFVVNSGTTEFLRLNFGKSLNNIPTVTNFGNLTNGLPVNPTSLFIVQDNSYWYIFVSGGFTAATSTMARIDFGPTLANPAPNIANFGNLGNQFNYPKGVFVAKDVVNNNWYGYVLNHNTNQMLRLDFSFNISYTPMVTNLGNPSGLLNLPTDMAGIYDNGNWYFFITNSATSSILRYNIGPILNPATITGTDLGNFGFRILVPSSISINKDCGGLYAYVTDSTSNQLVNIQMTTPMGPYYAVDYAALGAPNLPTGISSIIRDQDQLFAFIKGKIKL